MRAAWYEKQGPAKRVFTLDWTAFKVQFDQLYATLNGLGKLYLRY